MRGRVLWWQVDLLRLWGKRHPPVAAACTNLTAACVYCCYSNGSKACRPQTSTPSDKQKAFHLREVCSRLLVMVAEEDGVVTVNITSSVRVTMLHV